MLLMLKAVKNRSFLTMQLFTLSRIKMQINNKTSIKLGLVGYAELLGPRFEAEADNTNLSLNNSSYPARPHSMIVYYRLD